MDGTACFLVCTSLISQLVYLSHGHQAPQGFKDNYPNFCVSFMRRAHLLHVLPSVTLCKSPQAKKSLVPPLQYLQLAVYIYAPRAELDMRKLAPHVCYAFDL